MSVRTQALIDTNALKHNFSLIKNAASNSKVLAMLKGNAYGHGLVEIGKRLPEVDAFGVACLSEAIKLREGKVQTPIVIMSGIFNQEDLDAIIYYDLQIVLHDKFQLELLQTANPAKPISVWLKVDTGMHRLGVNPKEFDEIFSCLMQNPAIKKPLVVMTHLADADDPMKTTTSQQLRVFNQLTSHLPCLKSVANSAGIIAWPDAIKDWNRPGIMLYGISPILNKTGMAYGLKPVMTLKSKIVAVHQYQKGDKIGYGGTWTCPKAMPVGTIAIGYGDGYPRHARNGTPTLIHNTICPLVGRVSMDLITVDLRKCPKAKINDDVILWGEDLPAENVAVFSDTIAYELLCNVSERVDLVYRR